MDRGERRAEMLGGQVERGAPGDESVRTFGPHVSDSHHSVLPARRLHLASNGEPPTVSNSTGEPVRSLETQRNSLPASGRPGGLEAVAVVAEQLAAALRELHGQFPGALDSDLVGRLQALEERARRADGLERRLQDVATSAASSEEIVALSALLSAWVQRPNDLLIMVKLSEQASTLVRVLDAFSALRRLLDGAISRGEETP